MATVEDLLLMAQAELACPRCQNGPGIIIANELNECPECHGEHRNVRTIELLELLARNVQFKRPETVIDDAMARPERRPGWSDCWR
jgi:DnaJ-class molecular chaperone